MQDAKHKALIVIAGPTASGKTGVSVALAKKLKTVVFSADSRQFYKEMSIGTAKPTQEEMGGIPHFFVHSHSIQSPLTAATFAKEAFSKIEQELQTKSTVILTGGSGMFIDALCYGLDEIPHSDKLHKEITKEFNKNGLTPLLGELKEKDAAYYDMVDRNNPARIIRAIEVIRLTNKTMTSFRTKKEKKLPFQLHYFVLDHPREVLYERIDKRVLKMMERGFLEEVKYLLPHKELQPLNTVGYSELFDYLAGNCTLEEAVHRIQQNTRRYAKRQLTWFRRNRDVIRVSYSTKEQVVKNIFSKIECYLSKI